MGEGSKNSPEKAESIVSGMVGYENRTHPRVGQKMGVSARPVGMWEGAFDGYRRDYRILVADPPWKFASNSDAKPGRNPRRHYPCLSDAEIAALPVRGITTPDSILFMWTTAPMLERSLAILPEWGFRYKSQLVWIKSKIGTGMLVRNRHEIVVIATRYGFRRPEPRALFADSVIEAPTREHSRKPDELQDRIDELWPDAPKLELFARRIRPGWSGWGNDTGRFNG